MRVHPTITTHILLLLLSSKLLLFFFILHSGWTWQEGWDLNKYMATHLVFQWSNLSISLFTSMKIGCNKAKNPFYTFKWRREWGHIIIEIRHEYNNSTSTFHCPSTRTMTFLNKNLINILQIPWTKLWVFISFHYPKAFN